MNAKRPLDKHTIHNNARIAERLREMALLLEGQDDHPFRAQAYQRAAATVEGLDMAVADLVHREGAVGLERLPHIGTGIAAAVEEMVRHGRWQTLDELREERGGPQLFATLPGIGPALAEGLHEALGVESLEELELAVHDGRVEEVEGIGPQRSEMLRAALAERLARVRTTRAPLAEPDVRSLLDVDRQYRQDAERGILQTIAPRRFNPEGRSWLPVLRTRRGEWQFSALYSNTATAHRVGRIHDWVVIYFRDAAGREGQRTVVTETRGKEAGRRVVRGRELECRLLSARQREDATLARRA